MWVNMVVKLFHSTVEVDENNSLQEQVEASDSHLEKDTNKGDPDRNTDYSESTPEDVE